VTTLVDTPVLVDHLRGDRRAVEVLGRLLESDGVVYAATPTRTEIVAGIRRGEAPRVEGLFALLEWVDIDRDVADAAGRIAQRYRRSHQGIDTADYLIAAAAASIGAMLLTLNVKHFPMFPDLEPAYR
jgi:predicted nucleic acid-binding protein